MSDQIIMKRCSKCKQIKPLSEFYKDRTKKVGYRSNCKSCNISAVRKYQGTKEGKVTQNRYFQSEKGKVAKKRYRQSEKGKAAKKRYQQNEKGKTTQKRFNQSEKGKATTKRYERSEKGKISHGVAIKHYHIRHPERRQARRAVKEAVRIGKLPPLNTLKCSCDNQAEQYHHYLGYEPEHWLDVIPVCIKCHQNIPEKRLISSFFLIPFGQL